MKWLNPAKAGLRYFGAILRSPYAAAAIYASLFFFACFHLIKGIWTGRLLVISPRFGVASYETWFADPFVFLLGIVMWVILILASLAMIAEMLSRE